MDDATYFVQYASRSSPGRVLDFGCGRGATVRALRDAGYDAFGADQFFGGMDWEAKGADRELVEGGFIRPIGADSKMPFEDGWFDLIVSDQVLEHVEDLDGAVREMLRVLSPGGHMYHQFPTLEVVREAHFALPWIHRMSPRVRWPVMYVLRRAGFGKHTHDTSNAAEWATEKGRWLDDFCVYRRWRDIEAVFRRHGLTPSAREIDYCLYRAAGRGPLVRLLRIGALRPLWERLFRALGFRAVEFRQAAAAQATQA